MKSFCHSQRLKKLLLSIKYDNISVDTAYSSLRDKTWLHVWTSHEAIIKPFTRILNYVTRKYSVNNNTIWCLENLGPQHFLLMFALAVVACCLVIWHDGKFCNIFGCSALKCFWDFWCCRLVHMFKSCCHLIPGRPTY